MAYQDLKPQAPDKINISQGDLLGNFTALKTFLDVNHVTFNIADQGKHKFIQFQNQAAASALATSATEFGLYNTNNGSGNPALKIRLPSTAAGVPIPATKDIDITTLTYNSGTYIGSAALPNGVIMKWGYGTCSGSNYFHVVYAADFPTNTMNIQLTPTVTFSTHHLFVDESLTIDKHEFTVHFQDGYSFYWFAIGY